jgi:hypothetical protein
MEIVRTPLDCTGGQYHLGCLRFRITGNHEKSFPKSQMLDLHDFAATAGRAA